jgi:hypothetical protein
VGSIEHFVDDRSDFEEDLVPRILHLQLGGRLLTDTDSWGNRLCTSTQVSFVGSPLTASHHLVQMSEDRPNQWALVKERVLELSAFGSEVAVQMLDPIRLTFNLIPPELLRVFWVEGLKLLSKADMLGVSFLDEIFYQEGAHTNPVYGVATRFETLLNTADRLLVLAPHRSLEHILLARRLSAGLNFSAELAFRLSLIELEATLASGHFHASAAIEKPDGDGVSEVFLRRWDVASKFLESVAGDTPDLFGAAWSSFVPGTGNEE